MNINAALGYINYPRIALACWALRKIASRFAPRRGNEPIAQGNALWYRLNGEFNAPKGQKP